VVVDATDLDHTMLVFKTHIKVNIKIFKKNSIAKWKSFSAPGTFSTYVHGFSKSVKFSIPHHPCLMSSHYVFKNVVNLTNFTTALGPVFLGNPFISQTLRLNNDISVIPREN